MELLDQEIVMVTIPSHQKVRKGIINMLNTILSWGGCALLLVGLKLIGDKKKFGFYVALVAEVMWIIWGLLTGSYALVAMSAAITVMYIRAISQWGKAEQLTTNEEEIKIVEEDNLG